ncbi:hypothetical protein UFOVP28_83 [uncultured Caudovirales phage]|uniref:Uncharacterized protein n=1 Tax=uncultured Caudovirales phage TaxID=2100421 RepID=A0A6J5KNZ4_9CAUD|nr:hypothetical protein UFOVP28_83 [uncultured Caudovirales phage]
MSLRDEIRRAIIDGVTLDGEGDVIGCREAVDAILALISAHLASDEAVERARNAYCKHPFAHQSHSGAHRAALAAALGVG